MSRWKTFLLAFAAAMAALPSMAQGVVVFQKDGTRVVYPYEAIDSIVTYNYDETPPTGGGSSDNGNGGTPAFDGKDKVFTVNGVSFKMIAVKGGTFTMGATSEQTGAYGDELPTHSVTLSDYYIGETEVTQELWRAVMGSNPSNFTGNMQRPVEMVSWDDCQTFISKLNQLTGETFRLPTEALWEYAARGGNQAQGRLYSGSNTIDDVAWYTSNSSSTTHPVKTKAPNELGIYDMSGNVREWCSDWYGSYSSAAQTDPTGPSTGSSRVHRGGHWNSSAALCRVAYRGSNTPTNSFSNLGLRLAYYNYDETPPAGGGSSDNGNGGGSVNDGQNKVYTANGVSFTMIAVKGGTFTMGATSEQTSSAYNDELPTRSVTLSDYYIGETEVTQELWRAVMGSNPSNFTGNMQRPVEKVSWNDCQTFISRLNELTGETFRLPTEAQWEYAARGGNQAQGRLYSGSDAIDGVAWYKSNSSSTTHPVKTKAPNELGIYDMSGNVWEWCSDWYGSYSSAAQTDPTGPSTGSYRVCRGGGWNGYASGCRVAGRFHDAPTISYFSLGLRLAH